MPELRASPESPPRRPGAAPAARLRPVRWFLAAGGGCVIAGGLVAAVTAASPSESASWAAAYLVLVGGVAQIGVGFGQAVLLGARVPRALSAKFLCWNLGNAAVMAGTLVRLTVLTDLGGLALVAALALLLRDRPASAPADPLTRWLRRAYLGLVGLLMVSIPVGLVLAYTRHGVG